MFLIYVLLFVQFAQYKRCDKFHMIPGISLLFVTQLEWDLLNQKLPEGSVWLEASFDIQW